MKYLASITAVILLGAGYLIGVPMWKAEQAYKQAESYIAQQFASGERVNVIELEPYPNLRKVPDNIRKIESLKALYIQNTRVSDLSAVTGLENLEYINLRNSKIQDLSPLTTLPSFQSIDVGEMSVIKRHEIVEGFQ